MPARDVIFLLSASRQARSPINAGILAVKKYVFCGFLLGMLWSNKYRASTALQTAYAEHFIQSQ